jgi:hypothetical protein
VSDKPIAAEQETGASPGRKAYESPCLVRYGDVRDVTLGPSPGVGESGNPGIFKV